METEYYFVSDLHLGGDAGLGACDFTEELMEFLQRLESYARESDHPVELLLVGDTFGLWELTGVSGAAMIDRIAFEHPRIFEQFRRTGTQLRITVTAGNHDHDLACYPEFRDKLAEYNMCLDQNYAITRRCGDRTIWIEHGNQHDSFNCFQPWQDPHAQPVGYFITRKLVRAAAERSTLGRRDWLVDMEAVNPSENVPNWLLSNYFYREMHPLLRYIALPFLLFTGISLFIFLGTLLETLSLVPTTVFRDEWLYRTPLVGQPIRYFVALNLGVLLVVILAAIPAWILVRDFRRTLERYELRFTSRKRQQKDARYLAAAREVFDRHPDVIAFVYGHTHNPSLTLIDGRAVINTGTWLKRLTRIRSKWTLVPDVYYPSFRIGYFRVFAEGNQVVMQRHAIPKQVPPELTALQRILTWRKRALDTVRIPDCTLLPALQRPTAPESTPTR
ncbi:MAG: phosphoesterase [Spirochaetaceae bacterium]|nr:MAG: phosphoesterase [Spirochaetaceae bacterium]